MAFWYQGEIQFLMALKPCDSLEGDYGIHINSKSSKCFAFREHMKTRLWANATAGLVKHMLLTSNAVGFLAF